MYFQNKAGEYCFDPVLLPEAHAWCKDQVQQAMSTRKHIVVSNTFIRKRDVRPYFALAKQYHYRVVVYRCTGEFDNLHGVPDEKVKIQKDRYQPFHFEKEYSSALEHRHYGRLRSLFLKLVKHFQCNF